MKKLIGLLGLIAFFGCSAQNTTNTVTLADKRSNAIIKNTLTIDSVVRFPQRDTNFVARYGVIVFRPQDSSGYVSTGRTSGKKWVKIPTAGGTATWGGIGGNLSDQADLALALANKQAILPAGTVNQYWDATGALRTTPIQPNFTSGTFINFTGVYPNQAINVTLNNLNQLTNGPGYITANQNITISGDISAGPAPQSLTATLVNAGAGAGSCTFCAITVDAKGRVTAYSTGTGTAPVSSVFTRTGAITAQTGDYTAAQVTNAASTIATYADPAWITALAWSKITGHPTTKAGYGITDMPAISDTGVYIMSWARAAAMYQPVITKLPIALGGTNSSTALSNNRFMISSGGAIVEQSAIAAYSSVITDANGLPIGTPMQWHTPVNYATTANLTATYANGTGGLGATLTETGNGALSVDGASPTAGMVILVKNQTTAAQNGFYTVTNAGSGGTQYVLTRDAPSGNNSNNVASGAEVFVMSGTANTGQMYVATTAPPITYGSTSINFSVVTGGSGSCASCLLIANNLSDLASASTARTNLGLGTLATLNTVNNSNWSGTVLSVANGGFGTGTLIPGLVMGNAGAYVQVILGTNLSLAGTTLNAANPVFPRDTVMVKGFGVGKDPIWHTNFDDTVRYSRIGNSFALSWSKLSDSTLLAVIDTTLIHTTAWNNGQYAPSALASGHLFVGSAGNIATDVTPSGDLTVTNTGAFTLLGINSNVFPANTFLKFAVNAKGLVPSATAVVQSDIFSALTYVPENVASKSTDGTFASNSTSLYPSQSAVVTYVGNRLGSRDTSINISPTNGSATYVNSSLIGMQIMGLFINGTRVATQAIAGRTSVAFNGTTGTFTLTNGTFSSSDDNSVQYVKQGSVVSILDSNTYATKYFVSQLKDTLKLGWSSPLGVHHFYSTTIYDSLYDKPTIWGYGIVSDNTNPDSANRVSINPNLLTTHAIFTPTTGQTVTATRQSTNIINPAGTIATLTIALPGSPANDERIEFIFEQTVTTLTWSGGTVQGHTTPTIGQKFELVFDSGTSKWY